MNIHINIDNNFVALYGAILSTILAVINYLKFHKDKPIIKVSVKGDWQFYPKNASPFPEEKSLIHIKAVNIGYRPTTVTSAGLVLPKGTKNSYLLCADEFTKALHPTELSEGKAKDFYAGETTIRDKYRLTPDKYVAYVCDEAGRMFYSHNMFQRFIKLRKIK